MLFGIETLVGICAVILLAYYYFVSKYSYWENLGVKGPKGHPPFGTFLKCFRGKTSPSEYLKDVYDEYEREPAVGLYYFQEPVLMLRDLDLIKDVLVKDFSNFADRGLIVNEKVEPLASNLFTIEPERWRLLRTKLSPIFTSGKLKQMFQLVIECSEYFERYVERLASRGDVVDVRDASMKFTVNVIGSCGFGIEMKEITDETTDFVRISKKFLEPSFKNVLKEAAKTVPWLFNIVGSYFSDREAIDFFVNSVASTIKHREEHKIVRHDFVDMLLDLKHNPGKLVVDDTFLAAQAIVFFVAGYHSSAVTMSHCLYELAQNQEIQNRLRTEVIEEFDRTNGAIEYDAIKNLSYLDAVFKETLRKYPPLPILTRKAEADYTFRDTTISVSKGQKVWIPLYAIQHDPNIYPDPQVFDPDRFSDRLMEQRHPMCWLPFGEGSRACIGTRFAVNQTKVGLMRLIRKFKFEVCGKTKIPYTIDPRSRILSPVGGIHLRVTRLES